MAARITTIALAVPLSIDLAPEDKETHQAVVASGSNNLLAPRQTGDRWNVSRVPKKSNGRVKVKTIRSAVSRAMARS
jgi:hypothetical protein